MAPQQQGGGMSLNQHLQANASIRGSLLASAPRMRKNIGTFTVANSTTTNVGGTTRIQLFNVGVLTSLQLAVSLPITIGTATATPSPRAPYNLIQRVRVTDYDGTDRVSFSGFQLFVINCVRTRIPYGVNNTGPITSSGSAQNGGIITNPSTPTAVGNATLAFLLDVPICYDPEEDLRGAMLMQTATGLALLTIDWAPVLYNNGNVDGVYDGAATTTVVMNGVLSLTVWQEYLMPQAIGGQVNLPYIDLDTVYELNGNYRDSNNIVVNNEKLFNYPNVRSVIGSYFTYIDGAANMLATDISEFRLIANGNNVLRDDSL
ncbi:MAG: hypothetical protein KGH96_23775, partial [Sphingomonadales bacterium]|nr:hypothetical protein [Sphingomonadales bacterium]